MYKQGKERGSTYDFFIVKENKLRALTPLYKIILPMQQSAYETYIFISTHVHSWPLKVVETLQGSPALTVLFP